MVDEILCPLIRKIVEHLDYQDLEHQHRIKWRSSAFAFVRISQCFIQVRAEYFKIHSPGKRFELITKPTQPGSRSSSSQIN